MLKTVVYIFTVVVQVDKTCRPPAVQAAANLSMQQHVARLRQTVVAVADAVATYIADTFARWQHVSIFNSRDPT